jgi:oxygen-independent coproporphyrinogen-3 oxidase
MQNFDQWDSYAEPVRRGVIPLQRAYRPTHEERTIREFVLQLKRGQLAPAYFAEKYGVDVLDRFREPLASLARDGFLAERGPDRIALTRPGLLRADMLLHRFFLPQHSGIRYT